MKLQDLTGQRFGSLTVVRRGPNAHLPGGQKPTRWYCVCDCGNETLTAAGNLKTWRKWGVPISCGCYAAARVTRANYRHGMRYTSEYAAWKSAKDRCLDPEHPAWKNYGGRGITMCSEWVNSFEAFFTEVGLKPFPEYELDRKDNNRGYEPGNIRWVSRSENAKNRRAYTVREDGTHDYG